MNCSQKKLTRRNFVRELGAGAALCSFVPRHVLGDQAQAPANERINIAGIGVGSQGRGDVKNVGSENILALCDVDDREAAQALKMFPKAKHYRDFRQMLDEME